MAPVILSLEAISPDDYVREVLPESYALWGAQRSFEAYAADFRTFAGSTYAKRRQFTVGYRVSGDIVASCKNYAREIRWREKALLATGIGAVFTPPAARGRGYATALLGALLDAERAAGRDVAFLYSDIHPVFYARLGFVTLPARVFSLRADGLDGTAVGAQALRAGRLARRAALFRNAGPGAALELPAHAARVAVDAPALERAAAERHATRRTRRS